MSIQNVEDIEGIGPTYGKKLMKINIKTADDLLEKGNTPKGCQDMAKKSDISEKLILKWVNMANLARIHGVGEEYSELLEVSGADSVINLSLCNAKDLLQKMQQINDNKSLVRRMPTLKEVEEWISQAKELPRAVMHHLPTTKSKSSPTVAELLEKALVLEARLDRLSNLIKPC